MLKPSYNHFYPLPIFRHVIFLSIFCFEIKVLYLYPLKAFQHGTFTEKKFLFFNLTMQKIPLLDSQRSKIYGDLEKKSTNVHNWPKRWLIFMNLSSTVDGCRDMTQRSWPLRALFGPYI